MNVRRRLPFLRPSFLALALRLPRFIKTGQFGDGREEACAAYVEANARRGDVDDVLAAIDTFADEKSMLVNVGDEKGELLDAAVRRADPTAGTRARHVLRLRRAADRPRGTVGEGVHRRTLGGQRRSGAAHLGRTPASTTGSPAWSAPSATAARPSTHWPAEHGFGAG